MNTKPGGFQGNHKINPAGHLHHYTPDEIVEYTKCVNDIYYFMETYVKIRHVDHEKLIPFVPRPYQRALISSIIENRYTLGCMPRQCGKTILVSVVILWYTLFTENHSTLIAAHKGDKSRSILSMIKAIFEELPDFLKTGVTEYNKGSVYFANGSKITATATSSTSARGETANFVLVDEVAFIAPHVSLDFFSAVIPVISSGQTSKIVLVSTPRGLNHFYQLFRAAKDGTSGYNLIEIAWNDVPGRDEKFRQNIIAQFGQEYWDVEFDCKFLGSSSTLIAGQKLAVLTTDTPIITNTTYRIYTNPEPHHTYVITVDVAEGLGGDASAMVVTDITSLPYRVVAVYRDNLIQPMAFPSVIHQFALKYNNAMVLVEANFGQQIADILWQELEYENIVQTARNVKRGDQISSGFAASTRPGLVMNKLTKRLGCSNLKTLIEQDQLLITDAWIYDELCRFVVSGASYAASEGHDDLVMCLVCLGWLVDQGYVRDATNNDIRRKIAEVNAKAIEDSMMALGGITRGLDEDFEAIDFTHPDDISKRHDKLAEKWVQPVPQADPVELHNRFMADLLGF